MATELPTIDYRGKHWTIDFMLQEARCLNRKKDDLIFTSFDTDLGHKILHKYDDKYYKEVSANG